MAEYEVKADAPKTLKSLRLTALRALVGRRGDNDEDASEDLSSSIGSRTKGQKRSKGKKSTKAIATAKVQVALPNLSAKNLDKPAEEVASFLRLTGKTNAPMEILMDFIDKCCKKDRPKA